jgi:hypothetical protein
MQSFNKLLVIHSQSTAIAPPTPEAIASLQLAMSLFHQS